jgi:hypothetical protein
MHATKQVLVQNGEKGRAGTALHCTALVPFFVPFFVPFLRLSKVSCLNILIVQLGKIHLRN